MLSVGASSGDETRPAWGSADSINSSPPLFSEVNRSLHETGYLQLSQVRIATRGNHVSLHGRVPSYYMKQVAQTAALTVPGVESVQNHLVVDSQ